MKYRFEGAITPADVHPFDALRNGKYSRLEFIEDDKVVAAIDAEPLLWEFARWCALQVIHYWDAPTVVRQYLETGDKTLRDAADLEAWRMSRETGYEAYLAVRAAHQAMDQWNSLDAAWEAAWEARAAVSRALYSADVPKDSPYYSADNMEAAQRAKLLELVEAALARVAAMTENSPRTTAEDLFVAYLDAVKRGSDTAADLMARYRAAADQELAERIAKAAEKKLWAAINAG